MKKFPKELKFFFAVFFVWTLFFCAPLKILAIENSFNYISGINYEPIAKLINFLNDKKDELEKLGDNFEKINTVKHQIPNTAKQNNAKKQFLLSAVLNPVKNTIIGKPKKYAEKVFCVAKDFVFPGACQDEIEINQNYASSATEAKKNDREEVAALRQQYDDAIISAKELNQKFNALQQELGKVKAGGVVIKEPIIEQKTVERTIEKIVSGISQDDLSASIASIRTELNNLNTNLANQINNLSFNTSRQSTAAFQAISLTNKIDSLSGTRLSGIIVNGVSGLTNSDIPDDITASNYLPLIGGTISGGLTVTGNATLGVITLQNATAGYFTATSTTQASTFPYASTTALTVAGDSWFNGLSTIANLIITSSTTLQNFTANNSTTTNATTTNFAVSGTATISSLNGPLQANNGLVSATTSIGYQYGGTGLTNTPSFGQILRGTGNGYALVATSTLGINTSDLTEGSNLFWTNDRFDNRLSATTTLPNLTTLANLATVGTITSGIWNGSSIGNAYIDDDITLANLTQITNRAISDTTGTLSVARGGTGQTSFGQGWLNSDGTTISASTSPTVNYLVATSTTATSTFAGGLSIAGHCVTGDTRLRRRRKKKNGDGYEYDEVAIKDIQPGDEIASLDEETGKIVWSKVNALMDMGVKDTYRLKTADGHQIRTTATHPYLVKDAGNRPQKHDSPIPGAGWLTVENIKAGDYIAAPKPRAGVFIDNANIFYAQKRSGWKVDFLKFKNLLAEDFDIKIFNYYAAMPDNNDPSFGATDKFLQKISQFASLKVKPLKYIEIARGKYEKKGDMDVDLSLDVRDAIDDLDVVIVASGDSDLVSLRDRLLKHTGKKFIFAGFKHNTAWEIKDGKYLEFEKIRETVELGVENKTTPELAPGRTLLSLLYSADTFMSSSNSNRNKSDAIWARVESLEKVGAEQVYDIEVEGTHNFIGNDIVAHNTYIGGTASSTNLIVSNSSALGTVSSGVWNGSSIGNAYIDDDITLANLTQITNRAISDTTGTLSVARGGTGQTSFGQGWLNSDGTTLTSSTSPTVNYITATSTTATSTFAGGLSIAGHCVTGDTRLRRRRKKKNGDGYEYDEVAIKDIQPGDEIASLDEKTGKIVWSKVNALMDMGVKKIYKLTTAGGKTIRTTAEHPYFIKNKKISLEKTIAFIDYANLKAWTRGKNLSVDLKALYSALSDVGVSDVKFYYGTDAKNDKIGSFFSKLSSFGYSVITKPVQYFKIALLELLNQQSNKRWLETMETSLKTNLLDEAINLDGQGIEFFIPKANFDVEITADALKNSDNANMFILFSGDGDFAYLLKTLKNLGKRTVVVSGRKSLSGALMKEADKFVTLERLGEKIPNLFAEKQNPPRGRVLKKCAFNIADLLGLSNCSVDNLATSENGLWKKVVYLKEGMEIAVNDAENDKAVFDKIAKIEILPAEQVYDIEVEGTHNFIGNDIVAHNTYIGGTASSTNLIVSNSSALGIVSSGLWNGSSIATQYGGTGQNFSASSGLINLYSGTASAIATSSLGLLTTDVAEGINQYWTNTRFDNRLSATTTLPNLTTLANLATVGTITSGIWNGSSIGNAYIDDDITLANLTQITNRAISDTTGTLSVARGGTGQTSFGQGWLNSDGTTMSASTSPTVNYITATSTTATSTFAGGVSVAGTAGLTVLQNGNIGMGTIAPNAPLEIARDISPGADLWMTSAGDTIGSNLYLRRAGGNLSSPTLISSEVSYGGISAYGYDGSTYLQAANIAFTVDATPGVNDMPGRIAFSTTPDGGVTPSERMRIDSSGNIGIGTTTPNWKLSVAGIGSFDDYVRASYFTATSTTATSTFSTGGLTVGTSQFVVQQNSGNVGIGTAAPSQKLHIVSPLSSQALLLETDQAIDTTLDAFRIFGASSGSAPELVIRQARATAAANRNIQIQALQSGTARTLSLQPDGGNVGIGTATPATKLSVGDTGTLVSTFDSTHANGSYIKLTNSSVANGYLGSALAVNGSGLATDFNLDAVNNLILSSANTERMRITSGGNIGIGTTSPNWKLSVAGIGSFDDNVRTSYFTATSTTATSTFAGGLDLTSSTGMGLNFGSNTLFYQNNQRFLTSSTTSAGNLTIGYQSATELDANGGRHNTGVGYQALMNATSSPQNTALGYQALKGESAIGNIGRNTAIGFSALKSNTSGNYNVALGANSLISNTTGYKNTASGYASLYYNTTGYANTASGFNSLVSNTEGYQNTVYGQSSVSVNTTGYNNTASGFASLYSNTTGYSNTAIGFQSLYYNTGGVYNTAIGYNSGGVGLAADNRSVIDNYATFLGYQASRDASVASTTALTNITAIGKNARVGASNTIVLGGTGADAVNVGIGTTTPWRTLSITGTVGFDGLTGATGAGSLCLDANKQVVYNSASDACLSSTRATKNSIVNLSLDGLSVLNQLQPSSFIYNLGDGRTRYGFIAEDTALVDDRLATHNEKGEITGIDDRAILSVAVKAIKEMDLKISDLQASVAVSGGQTTDSLFSWILSKFSAIGITFGQDKLGAKKGVFDGLEMKDATTGEDYCVKIRNGEWEKTKGTCGETSINSSSSVSSSSSSAVSSSSSSSAEASSSSSAESSSSSSVANPSNSAISSSSSSETSSSSSSEASGLSSSSASSSESSSSPSSETVSSSSSSSSLDSSPSSISSSSSSSAEASSSSAESSSSSSSSSETSSSSSSEASSSSVSSEASSSPSSVAN